MGADAKKESVIRELKDVIQKKEKEVENLTQSVKKLEKVRVSEIALKARQDMIDAQKSQINTLTEDNRKLVKEVTGWREQCTFFWEKDPKSLFIAGRKDTKEDRVEFRGKLEKMLRELKIEDDKHEIM